MKKFLGFSFHLKELELYKEELQTKPALLAINKMDLPDAQVKLDELMEQLQNPAGTAHSLSCSSGLAVCRECQAFSLLFFLVEGLSFWDSVSCSSDWLQIYHLEFLPPPPRYWEYRYVLPWPITAKISEKESQSFLLWELHLKKEHIMDKHWNSIDQSLSNLKMSDTVKLEKEKKDYFGPKWLDFIKN